MIRRCSLVQRSDPALASSVPRFSFHMRLRKQRVREGEGERDWTAGAGEENTKELQAEEAKGPEGLSINKMVGLSPLANPFVLFPAHLPFSIRTALPPADDTVLLATEGHGADDPKHHGRHCQQRRAAAGERTSLRVACVALMALLSVLLGTDAGYTLCHSLSPRLDYLGPESCDFVSLAGGSHSPTGGTQQQHWWFASYCSWRLRLSISLESGC